MKLDKLDQKLIGLLFTNARIGNSQIAKKLNVSKEVIHYRINRLLKKEIIKKFIPLVNYAQLGFSTYRIQLDMAELKQEDLDFFKKIPQTSWVVKLHGSWKVAVLFQLKNNKEFFAIFDKVRNHFGKRIEKTLFVIIDAIHHFTPLFDKKVPKKERFSIVNTQYGDSVTMGDTEFILLNELKKDGRASILEIARNTGFSATNLKYHLNKLLKKKIIMGFIPVIDYAKLGYSHFKVAIHLSNAEQKEKLKTLLKYNPKVVYITESYGFYDIECEVLVSEIEELFSFTDDISKEVPLKRSEIIFTLKEVNVNDTPYGLVKK